VPAVKHRRLTLGTCAALQVRTTNRSDWALRYCGEKFARPENEALPDKLSAYSFLPYIADSNIVDSVLTPSNPANKRVLCRLTNSRTLKLSTTSGGTPSRNRETFLSVVTENPGGMFYYASAGEGVIILYSPDNDKGLWYLPGSGLGPLPEGGRQLMKEAIEAAH
jgi:hypothetical protein